MKHKSYEAPHYAVFSNIAAIPPLFTNIRSMNLPLIYTPPAPIGLCDTAYNDVFWKQSEKS